MSNYQSYLKDIRSQIKETDVAKVRELIERPGLATIIDVREQDEYVQGYIPGATWIPRGFLESKIEEAAPDKNGLVVVYCAGGNRSAFAARTLAELGYTNAVSMAGGFTAWKRTGLPWKAPIVMTREQEQ